MLLDAKTAPPSTPAATCGRLPWVDFARGIALVLVLYRHCVVGLSRSGIVVPAYLYNIQEFVFNFRMPVFFLLSGMFLARSIPRKTTRQLIGQKAATLLYPYVLWAVMFITLQIVAGSAVNTPRSVAHYRYILLQPRELDHMWYLLALFNTTVLLVLLLPLFRSRPLLHLLLALVLHLLSFALKDFSLFSDPCYHYIFLLTGALMGKQLAKQELAPTRKLAMRTALLLPLFVAGQLLWLALRPGTTGQQILFLGIVMVACAFFIDACRLLYRLLPLGRLTYIGRHSLYIYILHFPVIAGWRLVAMRMLHTDSLVLLVGGGLVAGIALPLLIYRVGKPLGIGRLFSLHLKPFAHG